MQCVIHSVHYVIHNVQCVIHNVHYVIHNVHCVIHKHHEPLQCAMCDMQATALCNTIHYCTPPHQKYISAVKKHNITQCTLCTEMIVKSIISPRYAAVPNLTQRRLSFKQRSYSPRTVRNLPVKLMFVSVLSYRTV